MTDELLTALGTRARTERNEAEAEADEALLADLLAPFSDEQVDDLVARAMAARGTTRDEVAAPVGPSAAEPRDGELAAAGGHEASPDPATDHAATAHADDHGPEEVAANDDPARPRRWLVLVPLLAAAALLAWWLQAGTHRPESSLPGYSLVAMHGALTTQRTPDAPPEARPRYPQDGRMDWIVEPARAVREPLAVAILAQGAGEARWIVPTRATEVSQDGAVRIRGNVREVLGLEPGAWELSVLVGPRGSLPDSARAAVEALGDGVADPWQTVAQPIEIVADPS